MTDKTVPVGHPTPFSIGARIKETGIRRLNRVPVRNVDMTKYPFTDSERRLLMAALDAKSDVPVAVRMKDQGMTLCQALWLKAIRFMNMLRG